MRVSCLSVCYYGVFVCALFLLLLPGSFGALNAYLTAAGSYPITWDKEIFLKFTEKSTGKVVSLKNISITDLELTTFDPADYRHVWKLVNASVAGYHYIVNKAVNNLVVDVPSGNAYNGAKVGVYAKKTGGYIDNQLWQVNISESGDIVSIKTKINAGLFLHPNSAGGFILRNYATAVDAAGFYFSLSKNNKTLSLLSLDSNAFSFVDFNLSDYKQQWFHHGGFVINRAKNVVLDVEGSKKYHGAKVVLWAQKPFTAPDRTNQLWTLKWNPTATQINFETKLQAGLHLRQGVSGSGLFIANDVLPSYAFNITDVSGKYIHNKYTYYLMFYVNGVYQFMLVDGELRKLPDDLASFEIRDYYNSPSVFYNFDRKDQVIVLEDYDDNCSTAPCHADAYCVDLPGAYKCYCNNGFSGNGLTCADVNECNEQGVCLGNPCTNLPGSYNCTCLSGYINDGPQGCIRVVNLTGTALNVVTGQPVSGLSVIAYNQFDGSSVNATYGADGQFSLYPLDPYDVQGPYGVYVEALAPGYRKYLERIPPEVVTLEPSYFPEEYTIYLTPTDAVTVSVDFSKWDESGLLVGYSSPDGHCLVNSQYSSTQNNCADCGVVSTIIAEGFGSYSQTLIFGNLNACASPGQKWKVWLFGRDGAYNNDGGLYGKIEKSGQEPFEFGCYAYSEWYEGEECPCIKDCIEFSASSNYTLLA